MSSEPKATRKYTPLSIVALFFGSVEASLAYSFSDASESMQIVIFLFMGVFAVAIAIAFFVLLWHRNWVFYPPSEFASTSVESYINAMRGGTSARISDVVKDSVSKALANGELLKKLDRLDTAADGRERALEVLTDTIVADAMANAETTILRVDAKPLQGRNAPDWEEPYDPELRVDTFLDRVWLRLQPFPPYDYGTIWVLKDVNSERVFDDIGPAWAKRTGKGNTDGRSIADVGLRGGMALQVLSRT